ncbi:aminotransferase class I/II-fold pyridoxal phosphate-dependent enzyme [Streptomyces sp. RKND-216]|uniref:aminotransferase class I/II-fold pyridoxal phosphate-dependent enzyme n=1 Tax=Streptomyces sp. RKND-216 TaxID=2562581 RepID=UPI001FF9C5B7|nr:aminotransferase class I/II-fold pyridoxal phosphate-dependent enzyme [Streptomyces sp. RKND-216]
MVQVKGGIDDLALFGGARAFERNHRVGRPNPIVRERFLERLNRALDTEWLSNMGPLSEEFEQRVAELAGTRHCVSMCNATVALQMLVGDPGTGAESGDEVIVPALTFPATAHAVAWRGLRPVFCDVDPVTGLIDPDRIPELLSPRTRAILGVHLWGQACDVPRLEKIAAGAGVRLFFDAAPAVGCTHDDTRIGAFGDAEVFSFHATKVVNSFEGGAVVTNDDDLAERLRQARNFGFTSDGTVGLVGTNGKMSEAAAAMGLTSLESLEETIAHNRANHRTYLRALADVPGVTPYDYGLRHRNSHHYMMVTVEPEQTGLDRDLLLQVLHAEHVLARPYFSEPLHRMKPYAGAAPTTLPGAEYLCRRLLALPTGPAVRDEDIEIICDVVRVAVAHGPEVRRRRAART